MSSSSSSNSSSRLSLCHQSSFSAENTMVTIVPSFSYTGSFPLLSCTHSASVGPFAAGMPSDVPLWVAKALLARNFCKIRLPDWLSVSFLASVLEEEKNSTLLSTRLPFYYLEIARALDGCLTNESPAAKVVLQDVVLVRTDKLRSHFHELSRSDLVHPPEGSDSNNDMDMNMNINADVEKPSPELPVISVTGICSCELNRVGPFLQRAFSDYGFLTRKPRTTEPTTTTTTTTKASSSSSSSSSVGASTSTRADAKGATDYDSEQGTGEGTAVDATSRRVSMARSRLRRFRE